MAAGRWVGRGDKNGADGVAVNAMRVMISSGRHARHRRDRRGREGQRPDALQRRGGRRRHRPGVRRRGRPDRRHHADRQGHEQRRSRCWRWRRAARCTTRPRCSTWRSWSPAPRPPTSSTSALPWPRTSDAVAKAKGVASPRTSPSCMLDRPRHAQLVEEIRATGARIKFIVDGDVAGAIMAARPDTGVDLLLGVGGTPEGIIAACAMKCIGGVIQGRLWPKDDDGAAARDRRRPRPRPRPRARHRRPGHRRRLLLRRHRHHRRRADARRALPRQRRDHAVAGDALAQRHDPADHQRAPAREATRPSPRSTSSRARATAGAAAARGRRAAMATRGSTAMPRCEDRTSTGVGQRVDAGAPVDDAVAPGVDRGEVDARRERLRGSRRSCCARTSPATQSSTSRPGRRPGSAAPARRRCAVRLTWWAPGASIGLPIVTMPETRSGRRTARPRASMPPRLCPTMLHPACRVGAAIDSSRASSWAAALSVQPTLAWMWER